MTIAKMGCEMMCFDLPVEDFQKRLAIVAQLTLASGAATDRGRVLPQRSLTSVTTAAHRSTVRSRQAVPGFSTSTSSFGVQPRATARTSGLHDLESTGQRRDGMASTSGNGPYLAPEGGRAFGEKGPNVVRPHVSPLRHA